LPISLKYLPNPPRGFFLESTLLPAFLLEEVRRKKVKEPTVGWFRARRVPDKIIDGLWNCKLSHKLTFGSFAVVRLIPLVVHHCRMGTAAKIKPYP
jgi:hypothetical protein